MIAQKTFTGASDDLADGLSLLDLMSPPQNPDGDNTLRVFAVGSNHAVTDAQIEAALVLEEGSTKTVIMRTRAVVSANSGKSASFDGSAGTRACDIVWDEGDIDAVVTASRTSLVGAFKNNSAKAYWVLGVTDLGTGTTFTSLTLYAMTSRQGC